MVWVSSDLYSSSVFRLLTWYRPVSARSEQCGTEADMRAGAAHKRDVLPHSISGLRSIRWLAPWAPARAVVIGWAQRLGARWHSGRQLLGTEAEQNEYNRNINLGACGSSATERISASTAAVWTRVSYPLLLILTGPFSSPTDHHRSCCLRYQLSGCCNGSCRKDLAPNVDPAFRRRYFRRRRSTRPELYAMNTRRSTRPLCLVWRLPRRGGVLGICSTWQCHSTSLLSLPRLASSR